MKAPSLFDRIDDWINPIVVKELRQAVQSRLVVTALLIYLGIQVFVVGLFLMLREARGGADGIDWGAGTRIFPFLQGLLLFTCMLLIPAYVSVRLASERSDTNVDLLFISALRPSSIIGGKFLAAIVLALLVFSACAPFMTFAYLLRGLDMPTILLMLGIDFLGVLYGTQIALFLAAVPANRALKFLLSFITFVGLAILFGTVLSGTSAMMAFGLDFTDASREIWLGIGATVLGVLLNVGQFFFWTVAIISPPSSNRAPSGRLFLVGSILASGAFAAYWSANHRGIGEHGPMYVWCVVSVILCCLQIVISINERTSWGPRVARLIPRNVSLRLPSFLFSSGAAGGVLLSLGLIGLTLLANEGWRAWRPTMAGADSSASAARFAVLFALYVYCYAMTAVLLRTYAMGASLPRQGTWVVMVLLIGIGSAFPYLIAYVFFSDEMRYHSGHEWWLVSNPFVALTNLSAYRGSDDFATWTFGFTAAWAVIVTALSGPWFFGQVLGFRPLLRRRGGDEILDVVLVEPEPPPAAPAPEGAPPATSIQTG